jgi:hypothetical protein
LLFSGAAFVMEIVRERERDTEGEDMLSAFKEQMQQKELLKRLNKADQCRLVAELRSVSVEPRR